MRLSTFCGLHRDTEHLFWRIRRVGDLFNVDESIDKFRYLEHKKNSMNTVVAIEGWHLKEYFSRAQ